jgi:pimeloyl-ACP methyl ester carboxylesterase
VSWARHKTAAQLARWLGPWASAGAAPPGIERTPELCASPIAGEPAVRMARYEPARGPVTGTYLVIQGLHYEGPDDPRLDRFCRILASAGFVVLAPLLSDFLELRVTPRVTREVFAACHAAVGESARRGLPRPALFSISFGSYPAIEVAANERFRDALGALVLFGGFCHFHSAIRFAISGRAFDDIHPITVPYDPLNAPAVFVNLVDHLEVEDDKEPLRRAWLEMARRTWGRPELRPVDKRTPIAQALAAELPASQRELFLVGCGLALGGAALVEAGLARARGAFTFTDPSPHLARIGAPVVIAHGRDDDVIPYTEAQKLAQRLPSGHRHRVLITGMYGHTGSAMPAPAKLSAEGRALTEVLYALADAPQERL